jgi:nicotinamidase-related amidase
MVLGDNAVLLIVDVQCGFDDPFWGRRNNPGMEVRIVERLRAWRTTERLTIHAKHCSTQPSSPLRPGQFGNELKPQVAPIGDELVIEKRVNSCFIGTALEAELRARRCDDLVIVGLTTNHCVSTTARMAGNLGFRTWVISDATATFDRVGPDGVAYLAETIHGVALADLHDEFATVTDTQSMIAATRRAA